MITGTLAPAREIPNDPGADIESSIMYFLTNVNLIVPVVAAVTVIVIAIVVICVLRGGRNNQPPYPKGKRLKCQNIFSLSIFPGTLAPPFAKDPNNADVRNGGFPGMPKWLDLDVIVPVVATVIVICVGVLVVCVALTRKKQHPPMMPPG